MDHYNGNNSVGLNQTIVLSAILLLLLQQRNRHPPTPSNRRWTCQEVVDDLLNCGNSTRIHNQLRMQLETFFQLRDWLVTNTKLRSSRGTSVEVKLVIFIYITSNGASNRVAQERFNRGARSVSSLVVTASYFGIW
ncbi:MAG: hypothetical protein QOI89_3958 [Solirubrobacteraceae bacterium]|jgi:hypothetical protein|nr:hypothetical protein [Solirubrobacteraceae bacterium]